MTERQQSEARLQELQSELIHVRRVSEMGQMASALAHELNQPLSAVLNYIQTGQRLLRASRPEGLEKIMEVLLKAADQTNRAGEMMRRIRGFVSKGESERRTEDMTKVIEEATALSMIGTKGLGVTLRVELDPRARLAVIDRVQIQQVLVNLMRNAIEAMDGSAPRELTIAMDGRDDHFHEVQVADTGPGIAAEVAPQIFKPFVSTKKHGMGVGLSICRSIIDAHRGRIWAEPNPGGGTRFRFTVPATDDTLG